MKPSRKYWSQAKARRRWDKRQMFNAQSKIEIRSCGDGRFRLVEDDGEVICEWVETEVPGLHSLFVRMVAERIATAKLARTELGRRVKNSVGGAKSEARKSDKRKGLERLIRSALQRGDDPMGFVDTWAEQYKPWRKAYIQNVIRNIKTL